jgi:hypothetical protein
MQGGENMGKHGVRCLTVKYSATTPLTEYRLFFGLSCDNERFGDSKETLRLYTAAWKYLTELPLGQPSDVIHVRASQQPAVEGEVTQDGGCQERNRQPV